MEPLRFICFLLMLILLHLRDSSAHTLQDMKKSVATPGSDQLDARGRNSLNVEKVVYDGAPTGAEIEIGGLGGRKMMLKRGLVKEMIEKEVLNLEDSISGAAHSVASCSNRRRKRILKVECKLRNRRPHTAKIEVAGFTAFSADYHVPKSHPPRNN